MTEKEAQDILLGLTLQERWLPRISKALDNPHNLHLSRGRVGGFDLPMSVLAVTILLKDEA